MWYLNYVNGGGIPIKEEGLLYSTIRMSKIESVCIRI